MDSWAYANCTHRNVERLCPDCACRDCAPSGYELTPDDSGDVDEDSEPLTPEQIWRQKLWADQARTFDDIPF